MRESTMQDQPSAVRPGPRTEDNPPLGRFYEVGGRRLLLHRSGSGTPAKASGKLAPQRQAAGKIAQKHRARSIWNPIQGLEDNPASIGQ